VQLSSIDDNVPLLGADLLARLEAAWAAQGAPALALLAPGLTDDEMSEIVSPLGLHLPLEARIWWGWHDGAHWRPNNERTPERALGPSLQYMPLRDAVEDYLMDRQIFREVEGDPEPFRPAAYFPITRGTGPILCDCSVSEGAPTPIYYAHTHDSTPENMQTPIVRSFGEMVSWWIDALEDGIWRWDSSRESWTYSSEASDAPREAGGLL